MLPTQDPNQIIPDTIILLEWPPVLLVIKERQITKDAW
jgi:hypothetical protein